MYHIKTKWQRAGCLVALAIFLVSIFSTGLLLLSSRAAQAAPGGADANTARNLLEFYNLDDPSAANISDIRLNAYSDCSSSGDNNCSSSKNSCHIGVSTEYVGCGNLKFNVDETNKLADASNGKDLVWTAVDTNSKYQVIFDACHLEVG